MVLYTANRTTSKEKISLRPLKKSDCSNVCRWLSYPYILQYSFVISAKKNLPKDFSTTDYGTRYFNLLLSDHKRITFAIVFDGEHIGNIGLKEIDHETLSAECFIEIGEAKYRNRGLGPKAMSKLISFAFKYGLKEIQLDVLEFNLAAIKVYSRLGFITTHTSGWHYDEYGQYWQVLRMSLIKEKSKDN
jgi:RimJ/RimL family protein N-acetyltransferase